jgi:2-polyprenyl-3-methyl-5-hydroxy-6-metoxy-1,4-benzoquinol methylase
MDMQNRNSNKLNDELLPRIEREFCWCGGSIKKKSFHPAYYECQSCGTFVLKSFPDPSCYKTLYNLENYWRKRQIQRGHPPIDMRAENDRTDGRTDYWLKLVNKYTQKCGLAIEVGCAHGVLLNLLEKNGWQTIGIEVSDDVAKWTRRQTGIDIRTGIFPNVLLPKCDLFLAIDVIEHVHDPVSFVRKIAEILNNNGIAIIQTPIDEGNLDPPFAERWKDVFDDVEHLFIFNRKSISVLFEQVGLEIVANQEKWITCHEIVVVRKPEKSVQKIYTGSPDISLNKKEKLILQIAEWAKHAELEAVEGGWIYKKQFYPDYLTVGGASFAIFHLALRYLRGKGIDHGCGYWPLPGSIPIDIQGQGAENRLANIPDKSLDYVFSSHFLEHVEDWITCLLKWNSILMPRGKLFLYLPHPDCELWHRGSPMIGEGHRWIPQPEIVIKAVKESGFKILQTSLEPDGMHSFHLLAEKEKNLLPEKTMVLRLHILDKIKPQNKQSVYLSNLEETFSGAFVGFMGIINAFASKHGFRQFTNWSKIWEYPWLWFNGLECIDWANIKLLDLGSELSPMAWFLASLGAKVTLIEADDQWVHSWEEVRKNTGLYVNWHITRDERLPFADNAFDVATSFSVIEHQDDKHLAIDEIVRVLKPNGMLAMSFDICEPDMDMTFPEWNGKALTMKEFEELVWENPAFDNGGGKPQWNVDHCAEFIKWHLQSAPFLNYVVGAAILRKAR